MAARRTILPAHLVRSLPNGFLQEYVNEIIGTIECEIRDAVESRLTSIRTELPSMFDVPGMTQDNAQRLIYYTVLKSLEDAGYTAKMEFVWQTHSGTSRKPRDLQQPPRRVISKVYIGVHWITKKDIDAEAAMDAFIQERSISVQRSRQQPPQRRRS